MSAGRGPSSDRVVGLAFVIAFVATLVFVALHHLIGAGLDSGPAPTTTTTTAPVVVLIPPATVTRGPGQ